jgi:hypothetical protein
MASSDHLQVLIGHATATSLPSATSRLPSIAVAIDADNLPAMVSLSTRTKVSTYLNFVLSEAQSCSCAQNAKLTSPSTSFAYVNGRNLYSPTGPVLYIKPQVSSSCDQVWTGLALFTLMAKDLEQR